jgi:hypothetical protein
MAPPFSLTAIDPKGIARIRLALSSIEALRTAVLGYTCKAGQAA